MKKLLIAAAIVCAAAVSQAASASWMTDYITDPSGTMCMGEGYVNMYLFTIDSTQYDTLTKGLADSAISAKVWDTYKGSLASADVIQPDDGQMMFTLIDTGADYSKGQTAYAAFVMTYDTGDGITHYKGNVGALYFEESVEAALGNMDNLVFGTGGSTALAWSTVPEPTSGLLLLLGVAGLALRRRRA